jgi:hypothetical protein
MQDTVICHSEYTYAEKPIGLIWHNQQLGIRTILAQWNTPNGKTFRVETDDGQVFELTYVPNWDEWQVHQP